MEHLNIHLNNSKSFCIKAKAGEKEKNKNDSQVEDVFSP